jgi:2,3-bisphosphoglycerate-dependent phosphoglycerate mutase
MSDVHCPARLIVAASRGEAYEIDTTTGPGGGLTAPGRAQARELAQRLSGERVAGVVCSPLSHAVQTAEIAAGVLGLAVEVRAGLREPAGGETDEEVAVRALAVLDDVADRFRGETVLAVSHGGVVRAVWGWLVAGTPAPVDVYDVPGCTTYVLERDADGWRVGEPVGWGRQ